MVVLKPAIIVVGYNRAASMKRLLETIKCAIATTPKDGAIYLVKKLSENTGFFVTNGHLLYLVYNFENIAHKSMQTDYLLLNTDVEIHSFKNNQMFSSGKYNVLDFLPTDKGYDENNLDSFINLSLIVLFINIIIFYLFNNKN